MHSLTQLPDHLRQNVQPQDDGCWLWTGSVGTSGHGVAYYDSRTVGAHRAVWEALNGSLPEVLHHECRNRLCVNPTHLTPTTFAAHVDSGPGVQRAKDQCPRGHEYTPENTYLSPRGFRMCRRCRREDRVRLTLRDSIPALRHRRRRAA